MSERASIRQEHRRVLRSLRMQRALPAAVLALALVIGLVAWQLMPSDSHPSAVVGAATGAKTTGGAAIPPGAGRNAGAAAGKGAVASAAPRPAKAAVPAVPVTPALPPANRAATSGPFPSGVNAGTLTQSNAWAAFRGRANDVVVTYTERGSWDDILHPWIGADSEHFAGFAGSWVVSVPMFPDSGPDQGNLPACATGAYDGKWQQFGRWLVSQGRGSSFVRLGWEFNGGWFAWNAVNDPTDWMSCFRHESAAIRAADPAVRIDWNLNAHGSTGEDAFSLYPGDAYVDVIGVDSYDEYPPSPDAASFANQCNGTDGLCVAIRFARAHHKLFSVPEWGVVSQTDTAAGIHGGGDNPLYIQQMYNLFVKNADILAYESYFNDSTPGNVHSSLLNPDENPASAAMYAKLWSQR